MQPSTTATKSSQSPLDYTHPSPHPLSSTLSATTEPISHFVPSDIINLKSASFISLLKGCNTYRIWAQKSISTGMHANLDMWLQHLQSGNSHECQVGYCDSSQVWSQSQYSPPDPEEWLQFPGQRMHGLGQLHLRNHIYSQLHASNEEELLLINHITSTRI